MNGAAVVAAARGWIDTPYQHQARLQGVGVDCAGLIIGVARSLGMVAPGFDVQGYRRVPDGVTLCGHCDRFMRRVERRERQLGDVIVLHHPRSNGRIAAHMGILGDHPHGGYSLVHAMGNVAGKGAVVEERLTPCAARRIVAVYRMPGVD